MESDQFTTVFDVATLGEAFESGRDTTAEHPGDSPTLVEFEIAGALPFRRGRAGSPTRFRPSR